MDTAKSPDKTRDQPLYVAKKRSIFDLIEELLTCAKTPTPKTHLNLKTGLTWNKLTMHLDKLETAGLVQKRRHRNRILYMTTPEGSQYLESYSRLKSQINYRVKTPCMEIMEKLDAQP